MEFSDQPPRNPAVPRDAATVILLRDTDQGLEVFLQRRVAAMAFAAGMTVFPGGGVDHRDADASVSWAGPSPSAWAGWFGGTESVARALVCAAVRETFEESGVLLAGTEDGLVDDTSPFTDAREALVTRELSLAAFLAGAGLTLRADLLRPWAHWVTPVQEKRRYDTRFFAAVLPPGQDADGKTTEAESSGWQRPKDALADAEAGRSTLMPPTWHTLSELAEFGTAEEALAAERTVETIIPRLVREGDKIRVIMEAE
ncbi:NUDIX domain-containing protein [Amycolatopsis cynarae]|uniref:NUDIX domain-containing protein n=1 Tax=Amycolatopsis cynarae TaxID=2995223 RepID=A0ABY7BHA5_9PSEU|nr:NUDIX domain-containing protein [Amycolatopsis sp. HUAS 11-8]WAL69968.1 NUDIX domain-containing protein [Amycolatopsis sp. HUAS 11-8]